MTRIGWIVFTTLLLFITEGVLFYNESSLLNVLSTLALWVMIILNLVFGE